MRFNHFLSSYYPDVNYGGQRLYGDMVEQAKFADVLGYDAVSIPEHHLLNVLLTPAPLQMAVKVAAVTKRVEIVTSIAVLPLHDMRIFAGEVVQADILCDGRLTLGVGRGAFKYEMERLGVAMDDTRECFDESLAVLEALLTQENVSWDGKYYKFDPITIMPRPMTKPMPQMMIAALAPQAIYHCAKRGMHVQTTPLEGNNQLMMDQVAAFHEGKAQSNRPDDLKLSLLRVCYTAIDQADADKKLALTNDYFKRFDNVFTGPGEVKNGQIEALERSQTIEELSKSVLICPAAEMIDRLAYYDEAGIDEIILNANTGASQNEVLDAMQRFAEEVMPHFK